MIHFIYRWYDKRLQGKDTRYVGITVDPNMRFYQHLSLDGANPKKDAWIQELLSLDLEPGIEIIEIVYEGKKAAYQKEERWIKHFRDEGHPLTNIIHVSRQAPPDEPEKSRRFAGKRNTRSPKIAYYAKFEAVKAYGLHGSGIQERNNHHEFDRAAKKLGITPNIVNTYEYYKVDDVKRMRKWKESGQHG
jgi:predicted GIY-YIG superfamily endonuclease